MPLSNASRLADFGTGIGTAGAIIQVDNANQRLGVGTTAPTATLGVAGIVSATAFYGDGSNLDGVASAGLGTALSEEEFNPLTVIYQTSDTLSVGATITVDPPDATTKVAYTQYSEVKLEGDADLIVAEGDDFIPDILGLSTEGAGGGAAYGNNVFNTVYADNIEKADGRGAPNFPKGINVSYTGVSTFTGNVSIGGTLTYEDVTNVDSIGVVTARNGIDVTAGGIDITAGGLDIAGISTFSGQVNINGTANQNGELKIIPNGSGVYSHIRLRNAADSQGASITAHVGSALFVDSGTNGNINYRANGNGEHLWQTAGSERLRIGNSGQIGIAGANYGTDGQVLTSKGGSAAVQWADAGGGQWTFLGASSGDISNGTSTIDITDTLITSTYYRYKLVFNINTDVGDPSGKTGFRFKANNTWVSSAIYRTGYRPTSGTMTAAYMDRCSLLNEDIRTMYGEMILWNPLNASNMPHDISITGVAMNNKNLINSSGYWSGTTLIQLDENSGTNHPITGIQFNSERTIVDTNAGNAQRTFWTLYGDKGA